MSATPIRKAATDLAPTASGDKGNAASAEVVAQVWLHIKADFARKGADAVMRAWLAPLELLEFNDGKVTLAAPSRFAAAWLEREYRYQLEALWCRYLPAARKLVIVARPRPPVEARSTSISSPDAAVVPDAARSGDTAAARTTSEPECTMIQREYSAALRELETIETRRRQAIAQAIGGDPDARDEVEAADEALEACQSKLRELRSALEVIRTPSAIAAPNYAVS